MNKGVILANKVLKNPSLIDNMSEDKFFKFVISVAKHDKEKAIELEEIKPFHKQQ